MNTIGDDATLTSRIAAYLQQQVGHAVRQNVVLDGDNYRTFHYIFFLQILRQSNVI